MGIFLILGISEAMAKSDSTVPSYTSWVTYWDKTAPAALKSAGPKLEEVMVFAYHFNLDDHLVPAGIRVSDLKESVRALKGKKVPRQAISIVNDVDTMPGILLKDPTCVHRVVATPEARAAHVSQIRRIATDADSIDIDYERIAPEDSANFLLFIQALADALHQDGKRLSVVVEPRVADRPVDDPLSNASNTLSWPDLAQAADRLTIMAYLYHYGGSPPGSIAPVDWVGEIAAYGLAKVPPEKLCVALHLGGFDWTEGSSGKSIDFNKADALAAAYESPIRLDPKTQSGFFRYKDSQGAHEVWIETSEGLHAKVRRLQELGVTQIALWRLGAGDPAFWKQIPRRR